MAAALRRQDLHAWAAQQDTKLDLDAELVLKLRSVAHLDGLPMDARSVTDEIAAMEVK